MLYEFEGRLMALHAAQIDRHAESQSWPDQHFEYDKL